MENILFKILKEHQKMETKNLVDDEGGVQQIVAGEDRRNTSDAKRCQTTVIKNHNLSKKNLCQVI